MMRSVPVEWGLFGVGPWNYSTNAQNVYDFWVAGTERAEPYESIFTIGMRGDGDCKVSPLIRDRYNLTSFTSAIIREYEYCTT